MQAAVGDDPLEITAADWRSVIAALAPVEGVCGPADFQVTPRALGANLSIDINSGRALVHGKQGRYAVWSDAGENRSQFDNGAAIAAPGAGTRVHLVYLKVRDRQQDGDSYYDGLLSIAQDAGFGAVLPPSAIPLAKLALSAGNTSIQLANITDVRPFARGLGASVTQPYYGFISGTTDAQGYLQLPHTLGRKPVGCVATFSHPAPAAGLQATHASVDMTTATTSQVRARVWYLQPYNVWNNKPVNISYICW